MRAEQLLVIDVPDLSAGTCFWSEFLPTCFAFAETLPSGNHCWDEPKDQPFSSVFRLEEDYWKTLLMISIDEELKAQKKLVVRYVFEFVNYLSPYTNDVNHSGGSCQ